MSHRERLSHSAKIDRASCGGLSSTHQLSGGAVMVATMHEKPGAPPGVDNLILVSSDTHIGPKLSQLREDCPEKYLEQFDDFAKSKEAEIGATMAQAELALKLSTGAPESEIMEMVAKLGDVGGGMAGVRLGDAAEATRDLEIAACMGNAMPTADMVGAMQMIANRRTEGHRQMRTRIREMNADGLSVEIIFHGSQNGEPIPFI